MSSHCQHPLMPPVRPPPRSWLERFFKALSNYTPSPARFVFSSALLWHSLAVRSFIMTPFSTLRAVTTARPISFTSAEILQYLGGLNLGYAVLALQGLLLSQRETVSRKRAALILSIVSLLPRARVSSIHDPLLTFFLFRLVAHKSGLRSNFGEALDGHGAACYQYLLEMPYLPCLLSCITCNGRSIIIAMNKGSTLG